MPFLLYGSYGYTGNLIAEEAEALGMEYVLAGRDPVRLEAQAKRLDAPFRIVAVDDARALDAAMGDVTCVLNCAGPFTYTASPVVEACFRTGTHYLDITGEVNVLQNLASQHSRARATEITLLPSVGFDVVPTDCLAARVSNRLPGADVLEIAVYTRGGFSRGTAKTALEQAREGGKVRHQGNITSVPTAWRSRTVDFGTGAVDVTAVPLPDIVTAFYSAQVPTIVTYARLPDVAHQGMKLATYVGWLLKYKPVRNVLQRLLDEQPPGPTPEERRVGSSFTWAQASKEDGQTVISRLSGPEPYTFTIQAALKAVRRTMHGSVPHGFQTPATAFGHSFVEGIEGVGVEDIL